MGSGQATAKASKRQLRDLIDLIHASRAEPSFPASQHVGLDGAPEAFRHFDRHEEARRK